MDGKPTMRWHGVGRWLAFALATLLILIAIPLVFHAETGAMAGWNIFLGLLLAGAVGSGSRHAPPVAFLIAAILLIRIVTSVLFVPINIGLLFDMLMAAMAAVAAQDLRRQAHANP